MEALLHARALALKSQKEWQTWCTRGERIATIPSDPGRVYQHDGWQGYGHWLGTGNVLGGRKQTFLPFEEALLHARTLKLTSKKGWDAWCKSGGWPDNMPAVPDQVYTHEGWRGYGHWLGTGNIGFQKDQQFMPFKKAQQHACSLGLNNKGEGEAWRKTAKRAANIPAHPEATYKHEGWQGYGHWLGTGNVLGGRKQEFLPFKEALLHARSLELKGAKEWEAWCKTPARDANVPTRPDRTYTLDGWQGYGHWLGTGAVATQRFLPFKKALLHARSLKLKGSTEWREWSKTSARPANIPSNPGLFYQHDGWQGIAHWLGTA